MRCVISSFLLLLAGVVVAAPTPLAPLLVAVTRNARCPSPARADLRLVRGKETTSAVLLCAGRTWYLETASGFRALARAHKQIVLRDGHPTRAGVRTQIPNTDLLLEELALENVHLSFPQVNDEGPDGIVVAGDTTTPSLYVLFVRTIDPARAVVVNHRYYKDDIATLMKNRHDRDFVQLDEHWRPGRIEIEDYVEHSTTTITLTWRTMPELPQSLFTPAGLTRPSGLTLPSHPSPS